jgi:hypothetical protein
MFKIFFTIFFFATLHSTFGVKLLKCHVTFNEFCEIRNEVLAGNEEIQVDVDSEENWNIKEVAFTGSSVKSFPGKIFLELPSLEGLLMVKQKLREIKANSFLNARFLNILDLSLNKIEQLEDDSFKGASSLVSLQLSSNKIFELRENSLNGLPKLTTLDLKNNQLKSIHPGALKNLLNLKNLNLENNFLVSIPKSLFSSNLKLEFINLNGNKLSKIWRQTFSQLGNLKTLLIGKNECVDEVYVHHASEELDKIEEDLVICSKDFISMDG